MAKLKITDIILDEGLYPRSQLNEYAVQRMIDAYRTGASFPPIVVETKTHRLIDGRTRYEAYLKLEVTEVEVRQKSYVTEADVYADAVRLNTTHGQPLTNYDIRCAVARLESMKYPHDQISEAVKVPIERISEIIKGMAHDQEGELVALKGGLSHLGGDTLNARQIAAQRRFGGSKGIFYIRQLILMIENDLFPRTDTFETEMDRLVELWRALDESAPAA